MHAKAGKNNTRVRKQSVLMKDAVDRQAGVTVQKQQMLRTADHDS